MIVSFGMSKIILKCFHEKRLGEESVPIVNQNTDRKSSVYSTDFQGARNKQFLYAYYFVYAYYVHL